MPQVSPDVFGGQELAAVYLAATLRDARRAEALLTERGVNYVVKTEQFGHSLFGSPRVGAVFYVQVSQADYCGSQLVAAGLGQGVLID
jgi:hypothetical protein